jgi:hypothetical protein
MVSSSRIVTELILACDMMSKGPKNFSESLLKGQVDLKNLSLMKACWPTLKSGAGMCWRSAKPW